MIPDRERNGCGCCARRTLWCWRRRLLCPGDSEPLQASADEPPTPLAAQPQGAQGIIEEAEGSRKAEELAFSQRRYEKNTHQIAELIRGALEQP
jgi:hypothetical protein